MSEQNEDQSPEQQKNLLSGMKKNSEQKLSVSLIKAQLREAEKRKEAYDKQKKIADDLHKQKVEKKAADALFQLQNTVVIPPKGTSHVWTEEELQAQKAIDIAERMKYKVEGIPRELTREEKRKLVQSEAKNPGSLLSIGTFYETHPEWFAFETRLRDMVLAIMEPVIKKTLLDSNYIQKIVQNQEYQKAKVDEFDYVVQKVIKRQSFQDDYEQKTREFESRLSKQDVTFREKMEKVDRIKQHISDQYDQMKKDRIDFSRRLDNQDNEMQVYREELAMAKIKMEADIHMMHQKQDLKIKDIMIKMEDTMDNMNKLSVMQDNISRQFVVFGAQIEQHQNRFDKLEPLIFKLKENKADRKEFLNRIGQCERDYHRLLEELEELRVENLRTDRYLQVFQPISILTEIDRMFRAVLPRRRHVTKMLNYTGERQNALKKRIEDLRHETLDKTSFEVVQPYNFCSKQSIDSGYIRESVNQFKQQQKNKIKQQCSTKVGKFSGGSSANLLRRKSTIKGLKTPNGGKGTPSMRDITERGINSSQQSQSPAPTSQRGGTHKRMSRSSTELAFFKKNKLVRTKSKNSEIEITPKNESAQKTSEKRKSQGAQQVKKDLMLSDVQIDEPDTVSIVQEQDFTPLENFTPITPAGLHGGFEVHSEEEQSLSVSNSDDNTPLPQAKSKKIKKEDDDMVKFLFDKVQDLEKKQMEEKLEQQKQKIEEENKQLLGLQDDKSERLSTIEDKSEKSDKSHDVAPRFQRKSVLKHIDTFESTVKRLKFEATNWDDISERSEIEEKKPKKKIKKAKSKKKVVKEVKPPIDRSVTFQKFKKIGNLGGLIDPKVIEHHHEEKEELGIVDLKLEVSPAPEGHHGDGHGHDDGHGHGHGDGHGHSHLPHSHSHSHSHFDSFGEQGDISEDIQFVDQAQMDSVKKQLDEQHRVNESLRSLITDVSDDFQKFKTMVSPESEFTFEKYTQYKADQAKINEEIQAKYDAEIEKIKEIQKKDQENQLRDRTKLFQEIQSTNRRIYQSKLDLHQDFESFSRILQQIEGKQLSFVKSAISMIELSKVIIQLSEIQSTLIKQDEQDKKGIFLMGVRENEKDLTKGELSQLQFDRLQDYYGDISDLPMAQQYQIMEKRKNWPIEFGKPPKEIITFNNNCFSCGDQPQKLMSAFKMACLSYKPGKISYQGQTLTRDAVISLKDSVLENLIHQKQESQKLMTHIAYQMAEEKIKQIYMNAKNGTNDKDKVLFYNAQLTENDQNILQVIENRKDIFGDGIEYKPPSEVEKLKMQVKKRVKPKAPQPNDLDEVMPNEESRDPTIESGTIMTPKIDIQLEEAIVTYAHNESNVTEIAQDLDQFNNKSGPNLINDEIRDQSDQIYIDLKNRDINGNVKKPIGYGIDDFKSTKHFYQEDPNYKKKLEKLAMMRNKSQKLYTVQNKELTLPSITSPILGDSEINLTNLQSNKGIFDSNLDRKRSIFSLSKLESQIRESLTPTGVGIRTSTQLREFNAFSPHNNNMAFSPLCQSHLKGINVGTQVLSGFYSQKNTTPSQKRVSSCLAMQDPVYRKRSTLKLVDPNSVRALKQIIDRSKDETYRLDDVQVHDITPSGTVVTETERTKSPNALSFQSRMKLS